MPPHVRRSCGVHGGDVADELLVEVVEFADAGFGGVDQRCICGERGSDDGFRNLWDLVGWFGSTGLVTSGQDSLHSLELIALELAATRQTLGQESVHQGQKIASHSTLIGMTLKNLLRVLGVDRDLFATRVIAGALERAIDPDLGASASHIERNAAHGCSLFEAGLGLQLVNVYVFTRSVHSAIGK